MTSLFWSQLRSMLVKDQLIRKRHYIATTFELFLPILMVLLHIWTLDNNQNSYSVKSKSTDAQMSRSTRSTGYIGRVNPNYYYYESYFDCYSFGQDLYYLSPDNEASQLWQPDYRTCGLHTVNYSTPEQIIRQWGDTLSLRSSSSNMAVFFDSLDLEKGIANYTVGAKAIDLVDVMSEPIYFTYMDYIRASSLVNILMANHPEEASVVAPSFEYYYTSKLFDEGLPDCKETKERVPTTPNGTPIDVLNFYQSYTFLEVGFLYVSTIIIRRVVREKATNSKELLRIMGLTDTVYWISHFINYFALSIFHGTCITIVYSVFSFRNPYPGWNPSLFWFNYAYNSISSILFAFAFTTVLSRPIVGVLIVIVGRAGLAYLPFAAKTSNVKILWLSTKAWATLLPSGQLHYSIYDLFQFGKGRQGAAWSNIFESLNDPDTLSLWYVYVIAILSWVTYSLLIWYLDAVWPWQPGTPKSWHFPVSQWFRNKVRDIEMSTHSSTEDLEDLDGNGNRRNNEAEPKDLKPSIQCENLYKSFGSSGRAKFAVNGIDLNVYKGQVTVLLGHNGAGKTTTMSMMTGMIPPSGGKILVNGIDVHRDTLKARQSLALCPQSDLLFEELTVKENLNLCAGLRGLDASVRKELIPLNIKRVHLDEKANTLASQLSGGMRRRLQLALALSTASEIMILDEPTSGLDPESRRQLWDLILELRREMTILLTTHFMEEADALGDRIIIMATGKIRCSGSSLFLKRRFGAGNTVRLAKIPGNFDSERLDNLVKVYFKESTIINENAEEIIYQLNKGDDGSHDSSRSLADLCDSLDYSLTSCGITSYGISVTTLEDVFLRVAESEDGNLNMDNQVEIQVEDSLFELNKILDYDKLGGMSLMLQRFRGLIMKRFHFTKRHYKTVGFTIVLPTVAMFFTFLCTQNAMNFIGRADHDYPDPILLDIKHWYGDNVKAVIRASSLKDSDFAKAYRQFMNESGIEVIEIDSNLSMDDYFTSSKQSTDQFMAENMLGIIEDSERLENFSIWHNPLRALSFPISIVTWQNVYARTKGKPESKITLTYKSMPNRATITPQYKSIVARIVSALFTPVAFCLIAVSYFLFPSTEAQTKANLIQKMSGIRAPIFWFSHYFYDTAYHLIVTLVIILSIWLIDPFMTTGFKVFTASFILIILYGIASIPLFYILSFLPVSTDRGFSLFATISLVGTLIGSGIAASLVAFGHLKTIHLFLGNLFPPFAASFGLSKIYSSAILHQECVAIDACPNGNSVSRTYCCQVGNSNEYVTFNPFSYGKDGVLLEIATLLLDTLLFTVLLILLDQNCHLLIYWYDTIRKKLSAEASSQRIVDDDVIRERERVGEMVNSGNKDSDSLIVFELNKDFGSLRAVDKISFGVHRGECFGLLGVNGAGKTTTFRMLTGDLMVTKGDAWVGNYSLKSSLLDFQQAISYCPQYDALLENLTPTETLTLFARIRGMPEKKVKANVEYIISSTDLTAFSGTCNQNLSGGNKRKLSLAIAAIAKPKVIFLDEPTTGVDPASRRKIWSTLMHLRETSESSIVLTSHSMDECEALCSRIGIMARGNFQCLGSPQYLKEKFGQGFTLIIKVKQDSIRDNEEINLVKSFIHEKFPSSVLRDFHQTILHYHITDKSSRWGTMLRSLDEAKRTLPIEDYTLSGTSLEQIFLSFARGDL